MDMSSSIWLSEQEMEDLIWTDEYEVSTEFMTASFVNEGLHNILSSNSISSSSTLAPTNNSSTSCASKEERSLKQLKPNNPQTTVLSLESSPIILSFNHIDSQNTHQPNRNLLGAKNQDLNAAHLSHANDEEEEDKTTVGQVTKKRTGIAKPATQLQAHVIAERKRRENLNQLFVALSAMVPRLKKMDKSSILEEAIKYIKQLKEEEKKLEVEISAKKSTESLVIMKKEEIFEVRDRNCLSEENLVDTMEGSFPEIGARVCGKNVLLRIYCEKHKGTLAKALNEIEKLKYLTVINSNAVPFGDMGLDITIIAQMENECCVAVKDLLRSLRSAFQRLR